MILFEFCSNICTTQILHKRKNANIIKARNADMAQVVEQLIRNVYFLAIKY